MRFLVVDDEEDVLVLLRVVLESSGHDVEAVGSARAARESCAAAVPDVLVADLSLPEEDGRSLVLSLREAGTAPAHVYLVSAVPRLELERIGDELGVAVLTKPFTVASLREGLAAVL